MRFPVRRGSPDTTHRSFDLSAGDEPRRINLTNQFGPVTNQLVLGCCSSEASTALMSWFQFVQTGAWQPYSVLADYYNERVIAGTVDEDSGATMPQAIQALEEYGVIPDSDWPFNVNLFTNPPPSAPATKLDPAQVRYLGPRPSVQSVVTALANGLPVLFGFDVYPSLEPHFVPGTMLNLTGYLEMPGANNNALLGGHANVVVGYDLDWGYFLIRNSWGSSWSRGGYYWMSFDYWEAYAFDGYVLVPPAKLPSLPALPAPDVSICPLPPKAGREVFRPSSSAYNGSVFASASPPNGILQCGEPVTIVASASPALPADWNLWLGVALCPPAQGDIYLDNWWFWKPLTASGGQYTTKFTRDVATPAGWSMFAVVRALPANLVPDQMGNPGYIPNLNIAYPEAMLPSFPLFAGGKIIAPPKQAPQITAISGNNNRTTAKVGETIRLIGNGFAPGVKVTFGGVEGTEVTVLSPTELTVIVPKGSGVVNVQVSGLGGGSAAGPASKFTFS